jgi:hypothetical protein
VGTEISLHKTLLKTLSVLFLTVLFCSKANGQSVTITSPAAGASYTIGTNIPCTATATAPILDFTNNILYTLSTASATGTAATTYPATLSTTGLAPGTYTFTAKNTYSVLATGLFAGTVSATLSITLSLATPTISGTTTGCGAGSVTLTASSVNATGGTYSWYSSATSTTVLGTGTSYKPLVSGTYYVTYTYGAFVSSRASTAVTINPIVSSPLSGMSFAYPFNAGATTDISGNANTGTLKFVSPSVANPTLSADRYGTPNSSYTFDGKGQYVTTTTAYNNPTTFTLSLWFNTTTLTGGKLIGFEKNLNGGGQYDRHIYMNNAGQLYFGIYTTPTANVIFSPKSYNDGAWHHVVVTLGPTNGSVMYVDDVNVAANAAYTTPENDTGYWEIGGTEITGGWPSAPTSPFFAGQIDDVGVYSTEQTAAQVAASDNLNLIGVPISPVCVGSAITFSAQTITGATYTWTDPSGTIATGQSPTFASAVAGAYSLTVTNGPGSCSSTASITPTLNTAPSTTFTATSTVGIGNNATITYTGTDPSTSTYVWDFNGGTPATGSGQGPFAVQWATSGTKTVKLTVTNANTCSAVSTQTVVVSGPLTGYAFSKPLILNSSSITGGITTSLSSFPALVYIQDNNLKIANACADKVQYPSGNYSGSTAGTNYDFAFTLSGTSAELNYQVENYDQVNGILMVWVQIPSLTSTNSNLTFYFGSTAPTSTLHGPAFTAATWGTDYLAVYHFNEGSATGSILDATSHGATGTPTALTIGTDEIHSKSGLIGGSGGGYIFNGTSSKIITATKADITNTFTLSAWVNVTTPGGDNKVVTNELNYGPGYKLAVKTSVIETETRSTNLNGTAGNLGTGGTVTAGTTASPSWHYIQGVFDGTTFKNYLDGVAITTTQSTPASVKPLAGNVVSMGIDHGDGVTTNDGSFFGGGMDEVRISNVVKSSDWIKAEYYNQTNPITFTNYSGAVSTYQTNAAAIYGALTYTWTGASSTDPTVAGNWTNTTSATVGQLPSLTTGTSTLIIPAGLTNYPLLTADESLFGLTIASGGKVNLNGHTLNVGCNIYNNASTAGTGILNGSLPASGINWNGTSTTQTYTGTNTTNTAEIGNMTVNNTAGGTISLSGGPVDIYNQLTITKGNLVVGASPAVLTLVSTSALTANVNQITSPYTITGTVNVERFITGNNSSSYRGYRLLSSATNITSATPSATGKNFISINTINQPYTVAGVTYYGIFTGGSGAGFNMTIPNPTLYFYKEPNATNNTSYLLGKNVGVKSIVGNAITLIDGSSFDGSTTGIPVGNGYLAYFAGSSNPTVRTTGTTAIPPDNATITHVGYLNQGNITVYLWYTPAGGAGHLSYTIPSSGAPDKYRGYNMIGNPYASTLDLQKMYADNNNATTGIGQVVYELYNVNPSNNYIGYNASTGASSGSPMSGSSQFIASGQGFLVTANSQSSVLNFKETHKPTTLTAPSPLILSSYPVANPLVAKSTDGTVLTGLHLKFEKDSLTFDECGIYFSPQWGDKYDAADGFDLDGAGSSIFLSSYTTDSVRTCINSMGDYIKGKRIKLYVKSKTDGNYNMKLEDIANIDTSIYNIYLIDHMNKDSLDIGRYKTYVFTITNADTTSFGANRLELAIEPRNLPAYSLQSFIAQKVTRGVEVSWKVSNSGNYTSYVLQKQDGTAFKPLYTKQSDGSTIYTYLDPNPVTGANTYRLQQSSIVDSISYSQAITIIYNPAGTTGSMSVYPNPAKATININMAATTSATPKYNAVIYNAVGHLMMRKSVSSNSWTEDVTQYTPGTYIIKLTDDNGNQVGKTKFVKTN